MRLEGKTAIVTGGGSGFGAGIVQRFTEQGAKVLVADINAEAAEAVAAEHGGVAQQVDVADGASVTAMAAKAIEALGHVDILVNNAGITHVPTPMEEVDEAEFDRVFAVNCKSVYLTARALVPHFKERGQGNILNMASTAGVSPRPRLNWYNASKGWMITATKAMAIELASEGIRVNALNPVMGQTGLIGRFLGDDTPERREAIISTIPLGRFSTPDDLAMAAVYLCSDEASLVTGVCMEVDGGRCI
ncbi:glucose 1-dehydrogenase [Salipiger mucosus]|uniref:Sorbitol dehydrogenase n=1 Tax=Salipiger mucosus DSM 16094 TaxID=1123237 RepID=S9QTX6_9RHOB|nr:glucose 1-dehydrogenase [Salipiger mucosus]EPX76360.1 Sorbitol dehydrogenase [Salipiger mucosus DSM 16094]EPX83062.1 Sorbitol dehydrogenase [Salipiger mucosus DSM 16094]